MESHLPIIRARHIAVDNVCAWPNVKVLPSGEIGVFLFNRPSHGKMEGDIDLWVSEDGVSPWTLRSTVSQHAVGTVRMNMAGGVLGDGTVVCLVSGWDLSFSHPIRTENILPTIQICRSTDAGLTWSRREEPFVVGEAKRFMPFGSVVEGHGLCAVPVYDCRMTDERQESRRSTSHLFTSPDGGVSWSHAGVIGADGYTETDVLPVRDGWLAAARTLANYEDLEDPLGKPWVCAVRAPADARSWGKARNLSLPDQHPGNLLRLRDGRIVFTCGSRISGFMGVFTRVSADEGEHWSEPIVLVDDGVSRDMGYPSTIELPDGNLLTAYYAKSMPAHDRYHLATVQWKPQAQSR